MSGDKQKKDHCEQLIFFENVQCLGCGHPLAYLPDLNDMGSFERTDGERGLWRSPSPAAEGRLYRACGNYTKHNVCNWAVPADDPHTLCASCRVTQVIPDIEVLGQKEAWYKLEVAKRRLIYSLLSLGLPVSNRVDDPERGLAFEFKADPKEKDAPPVLTGHANGVITINTAEADDAERERRRLAMHEPYRTLLGHMRHEIGHYCRTVNGSWRRFANCSATSDRTMAGPSGTISKAAGRWAIAIVTTYASGSSVGGLGRNLGPLSAPD
jgi:hypothetical protein